MPMIEAGLGAGVNVVRTGRQGGPPVVLVHAVGLDLTYWDAQIEALCESHDVLAYDLPGHGASPPATGVLTFGHMANVLAGVIGHAGAGPAHVVGLSVGGMIAQSLAVAQPDLVRSLTLIDTVCGFADPVRAAFRERSALVRAQGMAAVLQTTLDRWFTPATVARRPDLIDRVTKTLRADDPVVHAAMWEMIATLDVRESLQGLRCPALVLVGEMDPSTPPAAARVIAEHLPGAALHVLPEASHMAPLEVPDVVNGLLLPFLAG